MAVGFLLMASFFLITLYFLIQAGYGFVMQLLLAFFVLASASSLMRAMTRPLVAKRALITRSATRRPRSSRASNTGPIPQSPSLRRTT